MKKVNVNSKSVVGSWLLLSTIEELNQYAAHTSESVSKLLCGLIKDKIPVDRWDHCITQDSAGSLLTATLIKCQFQGLSPALEIDNVMFKKFLNMAKYIQNGRKLLINSLGGYCPAPEDATFEFEEDIDLSFKPTYVVNDNTTYINLENDKSLEDNAKNYLISKDKNYSYVLNLSCHTEDQLKAIFEEFVSKGGTTVYVYTTGLKVQQMYDYFNTAKSTGINQFEFVFNSGINENIQEFLDYADKNALVKFK